MNDREEELNQILAGEMTRELQRIQTMIWDGAGLTIEEFLEAPEKAVWRDINMSFEELIAFMREEN